MTARTLALTALMLALLAAPASAADFVVTSVHDEGNGTCSDAPADCTLRDAITEAGPADVVRVGPGTYEVFEGELVLDGDTVVGAGARSTIIDASGSRVFRAASGNSVISGVTVTGGNGQGDFNGTGGGILARNASLTVVDSTITDNSASEGGGVANFGGTLTVLRSTISANDAGAATSGAAGGGIYSAGTTTLRNSTVSGNQARNGESSDARGGGVFLAGGTFVSESSTIAANRALAPEGTPVLGSALGGHQQAPTNTTLSHTIIGAHPGLACANSPFQGTHNVIDDPTCTTTVANPQLAPLANNGGPTDTHAIPDGSPAVNAGVTCEPTDQRGLYRAGACDIGAFELGGTTEPPPSGGGGGGGGGGPQPLPAPEAGKTVNLLPKSGTVKVKLPGRKRFRALTTGEQLPVGTVVDTTKGRVTLVAAGGQTADFYGGIFRIGQGKGARPLTTLTLVEKLTCPKAGRAVAAAKKKKRRLWGDGSGKFRTKGKHSAATVVGTKWLVEDRCTSTLTRVTQGRVSVRDFVKKKTVIVRAGKKYVAKAKKK